ncbi:cytochrome c-type biogenesis protein CcmH/NrfF [Alkalibacillus flavidus]|uniref:Cytochrome c-type biogenesis protein CcmH/NrfF n=1 Tax=Alkalibacillus flavidus TaxID=546021 RepID=A0ABV2KXM8_9BACI
MKGFAKGVVTIGVLSIIGGIAFIIMDYVTNDWSSLLDFVTYIILEDSERALWQVGIVILLLGQWILKRQKRKNRIFY